MKKLVEWLRSLKEWMEKFAEKPQAMWILFALAIAESSFFPLPPDILLIAIAVSAPKKAFKASLFCTLGSVIGAVIGYYIGFGLMETVGNQIIDFYHAQGVWQKVVTMYRGEVGLWFLVGAAFSPIPFKVATIAAGATQMELLPFILISTLGRAGRFFLVGGLIYFVGPKVKIYIDKYFDKLSIIFLILLIGGFVAIKYII